MNTRSSDGCSDHRIDIHVHLLDPGLDPSEEEMAKCVRLARRFGIERIVMLGNLFLGWDDWTRPVPEAVSVVNTHTLNAMARYPDLFIGLCYLNPEHPASFIQEETERCIVEGGMRGIKLENAVKATDARLDPIMHRAQDLGVPLLHHAWYKANGQGEHESTPEEVADLAGRFPEVSIIMAHLGGGRERGVLDILDRPNMVVDTSGSQPEAGLVGYAVRQLGAQRVLYGSDWPIRDFGAQIGRILDAGLSEEEESLVLYGNAARILGLEGGKE